MGINELANGRVNQLLVGIIIVLITAIVSHFVTVWTQPASVTQAQFQQLNATVIKLQARQEMDHDDIVEMRSDLKYLKERIDILVKRSAP